MSASQETIRQFIDGVSMDVEIRTDYSGRGMYGAECLAIVTRDIDGDAQSLGDILNAIYSMGLEMSADTVGDTNAIGHILRSARTDSMGTGTVIYFPAAQTNARPGVAS